METVQMFNGSEIEDVYEWWQQFVNLGVILHPDDDAYDITNQDGLPTFSVVDCRIINNSLKEMFLIFGDEVYEVALSVYHDNFEQMEMDAQW